MILMGIDPSINSTGVCVYKDLKNIYYNIVPKLTKKMIVNKNLYINFIKYEKYDTKDLTYSEKEDIKTTNIYNIGLQIEKLIEEYNPDIINMEGVAYSSNGSVVDLAGLNYIIRVLAKKHNKNINILSPTSVKKFATGNGQAEKNIMIDAWKRLDTNIDNINDLKIDDLADAYFIAHFENLE